MILFYTNLHTNIHVTAYILQYIHIIYVNVNPFDVFLNQLCMHTHTHIHKFTMAKWSIHSLHQGEEESARPRSGGILKCLGRSVGGTATAWWFHGSLCEILGEKMGIHME